MNHIAVCSKCKCHSEPQNYLPAEGPKDWTSMGIYVPGVQRVALLLCPICIEDFGLGDAMIAANRRTEREVEPLLELLQALKDEIRREVEAVLIEAGVL